MNKALKIGLDRFARSMLFTAVVSWAGFCHAAGLFNFGDIEKPKPEFSRSGDTIAAKLVPRAKSTSIVIRFKVIAGGQLEGVEGIDFQAVDRPEVNVKNFKSAAFEIRIGNVAPGGEAKVTISSDFFSASTAFYAFNSKLEKPWMNVQAVNLSQPERVRELLVTARDGGPLDTDGAANGNIILIGGPRDSFWGYALGTLFIRFFGIFIVLSVLMIGMILSGLAFKLYASRKKSGSGKLTDIIRRGAVAETTGRPAEVTDEEVAVIAAAVHLQFKHSKASSGEMIVSASTPDDSWAAEGRKRIMNDRFMVFNRFNRFGN